MSKLSHFVAKEILGLSIGYMAGLTASYLVSSFFVKRKLVNLWGLTSKRTAVTGDTYEWIMAIFAYLIGLIVMLIVMYWVRKLFGKGEEVSSQ